MTDISIPNGNNKYQEDVAVVVPGSTLVAGPCVVWTITVAKEADATAIVSFSNSEGYDNAYRVFKVVIDAPNTLHYSFPKGLYLSTGLSVISNVGSVDVSCTYD
jgi:hypothetical protein